MFTYYDHCKVNGANELVKKPQHIYISSRYGAKLLFIWCHVLKHLTNASRSIHSSGTVTEDQNSEVVGQNKQNNELKDVKTCMELRLVCYYEPPSY